jgi:hypothetical protein
VLRLAADEDFNNVILRGARRRNADLDVVRVQDVAGLSGADDSTVLEWAAREERVLFTHDANTMTAQAYQRIKAGEPMPGLFAVPRDVPVGVAIEDLLLIAEYSSEEDWQGRVSYLPL